MVTPRPASADDALLGVAPRLVAEPASVDEAVEVMRACARDRLRVGFVGGGTDLGLGARPSGLDLVLRTAGLARVVEHQPADQIVVAEAGLTVAALQAALAPHGQRLALDPPRPERATLGGVVAANAWGPHRTRYGTSRDLLVGVSLVRADGVLARGGGKVVKNVAGFDLPRLMVGSLGTLALLATVTFRLHPLPELDETAVLVPRDAGAARSVVVALRDAQLEPAAVSLLVEGGRLVLAVRFEGFGPGVAAQQARLKELAAPLGVPAERLAPAGAAQLWARHAALRSEGEVRVRVAAAPSALAALVKEVVEPLARALGGAAALEPVLGVGTVSARAAPLDAAAAIVRAREAAARLGGSLVVAEAPGGVRTAVDPWGPPPPGIAIMRRLKAELDPDGRLAPGRFVGGI